MASSKSMKWIIFEITSSAEQDNMNYVNMKQVVESWVDRVPRTLYFSCLRLFCRSFYENSLCNLCLSVWSINAFYGKYISVFSPNFNRSYIKNQTIFTAINEYTPEKKTVKGLKRMRTINKSTYEVILRIKKNIREVRGTQIKDICVRMTSSSNIIVN